MRHHPTGLAIKPDKTELDNVAALDRLAYARNYLRKLIQLDVHLPTLAAAEAMQLLLNPIPQAVAVAKPSLADRWRTSRSLVAGLLVQCGLSLTVVAALGVAAFQVWTTVNVMKAERLQVRERLMQSDLSQLRQAGTDMRLYEKWSLQKADAAKKNAEASKQKTEDALQKANPVQEAVYRANADSTVGLIKTMEQALPTLEQLAREGREEAFRDFQTKAFKPGQTAFAALTQNAVQFDGKTWDTVKQELWTATTAKEAATKNLANGPKDDGNPRQREPSASKPATSPAVKTNRFGRAVPHPAHRGWAAVGIPQRKRQLRGRAHARVRKSARGANARDDGKQGNSLAPRVETLYEPEPICGCAAQQHGGKRGRPRERGGLCQFDGHLVLDQSHRGEFYRCVGKGFAPGRRFLERPTVVCGGSGGVGLTRVNFPAI